MIQDLVFVVDKEPDFAEAHNMLALARLQGGGVHSAAEAIKVAIPLSPRSEQYLLNLAQIDLAGKKWDDATSLLERLKDSSDPKIAQTARKNLDDLPTLKKYGILPEQNASQTAPARCPVFRSTMKTRAPLKVKRLQRSLCRTGANRNSSEAG